MDKSITPQKPRLLDQVRERLRYKHYRLSTEKVYVYWIRFFIRWSVRKKATQKKPEQVRLFFMCRNHIFRRYCPPTSNKAVVIWPSEHTRAASISFANTFSLLIAACCNAASACGATFAWR